MNTIKAGFKSWQTTVIGIVMAVLLILQDTENLADVGTWIFPVLITIFGFLQRDADKSSEKSGIVPLVLLCFICTFLVSCSNILPSYTVDGTGRDWVTEPIQVLPADRVRPNINLQLPEQLGGESILIPVKINIEPTK